MQFKKDEYGKIKGNMQPGDVIAFSGNRFASSVIKAFTKSNVSHVGIVVPSKFTDAACDQIVIAEVTSQGVIFTPLIDKVEDDNVEMLWWLPLHSRPDPEVFSSSVEKYKNKRYDYLQAAMTVLDSFEPILDSIGQELNENVRQTLLEMIVRPLSRAIKDKIKIPVESFISEILSEVVNEHFDLTILVDKLVDSICNQEDTKRFFCSEFVAKVLENSKVICDINASRTTPIELCQLKIYGDYVQFKGDTEQEIIELNPDKQ